MQAPCWWADASSRHSGIRVRKIPANAACWGQRGPCWSVCCTFSLHQYYCKASALKCHSNMKERNRDHLWRLTHHFPPLSELLLPYVGTQLIWRAALRGDWAPCYNPPCPFGCPLLLQVAQNFCKVHPGSNWTLQALNAGDSNLI